MWGHSGGGFITADAMFRFPDFFKVGISESGESQLCYILSSRPSVLNISKTIWQLEICVNVDEHALSF
jgi:predicted peptidase